jgi:hypothetical protein
MSRATGLPSFHAAMSSTFATGRRFSCGRGCRSPPDGPSILVRRWIVLCVIEPNPLVKILPAGRISSVPDAGLSSTKPLTPRSARRPATMTNAERLLS